MTGTDLLNVPKICHICDTTTNALLRAYARANASAKVHSLVVSRQLQKSTLGDVGAKKTAMTNVTSPSLIEVFHRCVLQITVSAHDEMYAHFVSVDWMPRGFGNEVQAQMHPPLIAPDKTVGSEMESAEQPVGRRVAYWRQRRGMSQQVFADALGKSKSWVDKIERGVRRLDKFSVLNDIADALTIDAQQLLGHESQRRVDQWNCIDQVEVDSIRQALERYERLGRYLDGAALEPVSLTELQKSVTHAWHAYERANYPVLARELIDLLKAAPVAEENAAPSQRAAAAGLLTQVYQIASTVLRKLGESQLSWLAADRAIGAAQRCDDPLLIGVATTRVANALRSMGRVQAALDINVQVAHRMMADAGDRARSDPAAMSVYGTLLLQGAMAASLAGDTATTRDLLHSASRAAQRVGDGKNHYWTSFGPTNVVLHRVAAAVELGEGRLAWQLHNSIDPRQLKMLVPERRAHHYLDLARGCAQFGDLERAGQALVLAEHAAPSEIRCRPLAHDIVCDVMRRSAGTISLSIRQLAETMGVAA